ncbi:MAG: carbohydrate-binding protein, partial [Chthoniobacteraceae bacterium]
YGGSVGYWNFYLAVPLNSGTNNTISLANGPYLDTCTFLVSTPFLGTPYVVPSQSGSSVTIEMENYDLGGEGQGFHKIATAPQSGYRSPDPVVVEGSSNASNRYCIGYCDAGEWLNYTVSVLTSGTYNLNVYASTQYSNDTLVVEDGTVPFTSGTMTMPNTGGYYNFTAGPTTPIYLTSGTHVLKMYNKTGGYTLDYFTIGH